MIRRALRALLCAAAVTTLWPAHVWAQSEYGDFDTERKPGTYVKSGLARWQGALAGGSSLTDWNIDYDLTSINLQVETYFRRNFLISGFSLGYRKDAVRHLDSGHMFNATVFRETDFRAIALKTGGGVEWGMPSLNLDRTDFQLGSDGTLRYRHTHPDRNVDVPFIGTATDGSLYPFLEFAAVQRPWIFLAEVGVRVNLMGINYDDYEVNAADQVTEVFNRRRVMVPYLFANLGVRLF